MIGSKADLGARRSERLLRAQSGRVEIARFAGAETKSTEAIRCFATRKAAVGCRCNVTCTAYDLVADKDDFLSDQRKQNELPL